MTDTSNQNPVQPQSDNPFFRPVANDPAPTPAAAIPDPVLTPQSPPAPVSTITDPLITTPSSATPVAADPTLTSAATDSFATSTGSNVMSSSMDAVSTGAALPEEKPSLNPVEPELPSHDATLVSPVMDNLVSSAPVAAPTEPAIPDMASMMPTENSTPDAATTDSLPGLAPVMPPQVNTDLGVPNTVSTESPATLNSLESTLSSVDNLMEQPKESLPELNSTLPDLPKDDKPMDLTNDTNLVAPIMEGASVNQPVTDTLPSINALAADVTQPVVESPVLEPQSEAVTTPPIMQPEAASIEPATPLEAAPTLPPLEPVAQPEVETPVVAPIAQEVPPIASPEVEENKPEVTPTPETAPAPAGKMKNLVLLLGVLVVGIMALVLGIIVASTQ